VGLAGTGSPSRSGVGGVTQKGIRNTRMIIMEKSTNFVSFFGGEEDDTHIY
jgi:hypothetical protein